MNEFQLANQQDELEALKVARVSFDQAIPQPFLSPPDSDVQKPVWGKAVIPVNAETSNASGGAAPIATFPCVIGINDGGTFRTATAFVIGPVTYIQ